MQEEKIPNGLFLVKENYGLVGYLDLRPVCWTRPQNTAKRGVLPFKKKIIGSTFGPPVDEVAGVQGDAEKMARHETKLRGADANDANHGRAVMQQTTQPSTAFLPIEHSRQDGQKQET